MVSMSQDNSLIVEEVSHSNLFKLASIPSSVLVSLCSKSSVSLTELKRERT